MRYIPFNKFPKTHEGLMKYHKQFDVNDSEDEEDNPTITGEDFTCPDSYFDEIDDELQRGMDNQHRKKEEDDINYER